jgi:DNA-binding XRE family transcriptional regulator
MKKNKLLKWDDVRKEIFSIQELKQLDEEGRKRIALREIQELREKYKLTQHQLSIKSGIPRSTISKIENGKRNVSFDKLLKIADALDKDLEIKFVDRKRE